MILNDVISQLERKERADLASQVQRAIHKSDKYTLFSRFNENTKLMLSRVMPSSCVDQITDLIDRKEERFEIHESPTFADLLRECTRGAVKRPKRTRSAVNKVIKNTVVHRCTSIRSVWCDSEFIGSIKAKLQSRTCLSDATIKSYNNHFLKGLNRMLSDRNETSTRQKIVEDCADSDEGVDNSSLSSLKLYCFGDTLSEPIRVQIPEDATQKHVDQIIAHLEAHKKQADNG